MWSRIDSAFRASAAGRWYATLQANERTLVSALAAFLAAVVVYLAIWSPLADWSHGADARYQRQMAVLDWMHLKEKEARAAGQRSEGTPESGSVWTLVANSAAKSGVKLLSYQPEGSGGVSVVLQNQPFNTVVSWLADLEQRDHVTVKQISIDGQTAPGVVNARINLK
jgi:general secretion pathway protein M